MSDNNNDSRTLVLSDSISDKSVSSIIRRIYEINEEDDIKSRVLTDPKIEPINLIVNSAGGEIHATNALIGAIEMSKTEVHTYAIGKAFSGALWVVIAGDKRFSHRFTRFMYHEAAYGMSGKIEDQRRYITETEEIMKLLDSYILERTKMPQEKLATVKGSVEDWFFSAQEALEYGVIDSLFTTEPKTKPKKSAKKSKN